MDSPPNVLVSSRFYGETGERVIDLQWASKKLSGTLHFVKCSTSQLEEAGLLLKPAPCRTPRLVYVTGGGAFKSGKAFGEALGIKVAPVDEMDSLVEGLRFLREYGPIEEVYSLLPVKGCPGAAPTAVPETWPSSGKPYFVVNIGSGVSMLKVTKDKFERVGGTALGGATFLGLCRLLTHADTFEEALALCDKGDNLAVDKLVGDIYGGDYERFNLGANMVASCFGKLASMHNPQAQCKEEDLALGVLRMVTVQIGLLATHLARQHGCLDGLFFVGGFLSGNPAAQRLLAYFCANIGARPKFLRHCDFVGAVGALRTDLMRLEPLPEGEAGMLHVALNGFTRTVSHLAGDDDDPEQEEAITNENSDETDFDCTASVQRMEAHWYQSPTSQLPPQVIPVSPYQESTVGTSPGCSEASPTSWASGAMWRGTYA